MDRVSDRHIILIGFMGAGKTTVGKRLAEMLSRRLLDMDSMIEETAGMSVSRIFDVMGEEAFRRIESEVLVDLAASEEAAVVSTGGGVPLREENRKALREMGLVVYLRVDPDTVLERLADDTSRPLLAGADKRERVESLLAIRDPIYRETAQRTVAAAGRSPEEIAREIADMVGRTGSSAGRIYGGE